MKKKAQEIRAKCIADSGVTRPQVDDAAKGKFSKDPKLAKFAYCFLTTTKLLDKDGNINETIFKSVLSGEVDENTLKKIIDTCKPDKSKSKERAAALMFECFYKIAKKPIIID